MKFLAVKETNSRSDTKCFLRYDYGFCGCLTQMETTIKSLQRKHYKKKYMFLLTGQWYVYLALADSLKEKLSQLGVPDVIFLKLGMSAACNVGMLESTLIISLNMFI